jgi:NAD-dependent histone deacetylase SIR2
MGTLRPNIVLYNEDHPESETIGRMQTTDIRKRPDLLIVMGTSLKIPGLKKFIKEAARMIHANSKQGKVVFVNRTAPTKEWEKIFDYEVIGDTDDWVNIMEPKLAHHEAITAERIARLKQKKLNPTATNNQHVNNILKKKRKIGDDQNSLIVTNTSRSQLTLDDTFRAQRHKTVKDVLIYKQ